MVIDTGGLGWLRWKSGRWMLGRAQRDRELAALGARLGARSSGTARRCGDGTAGEYLVRRAAVSAWLASTLR